MRTRRRARARGTSRCPVVGDSSPLGTAPRLAAGQAPASATTSTQPGAAALRAAAAAAVAAAAVAAAARVRAARPSTPATSPAGGAEQREHSSWTSSRLTTRREGARRRVSTAAWCAPTLTRAALSRRRRRGSRRQSCTAGGRVAATGGESARDTTGAAVRDPCRGRRACEGGRRGVRWKSGMGRCGERWSPSPRPRGPRRAGRLAAISFDEARACPRRGPERRHRRRGVYPA
jgi:hypothetical protein